MWLLLSLLSFFIYEKVKEVNRLLKDNIHREKLLNVFFIDNDNLDNEELLYDNKHLKKDSGVRILVSNLKRSVFKIIA